MTSSSDPTDRHLQTLVDVTQEMGNTFDLRHLLLTIEQAGRSALQCERATIFLYDHDTNELYSTVATGTGEIRFPATKGIAGEAAQTRSVIIVPDAYADSRFNPEIDRKTGYKTRNMLTLPLITPDDEVIGVLQVLNKIDGDFSERDDTLAEALGAMTAMAIKRQMLLDEAAVKQRLERDLNIACEIQQRLLPAEPPEINGFDIAGWNRPADQTGGDCFDFNRLDQDHLLFMIADATGHGIGPALIATEFRAMLRAIGDRSDNLEAVADRINTLLCEDLAPGRFVTSCFGRLDGQSGRIDYLSAGHGPILVYRAANGQVEELVPENMPLGIIAEIPQEMAKPLILEPGDIFLLLTDGFVEWAGAESEPYGEDRLIDLVRRSAGLGAGDLIRALYDDVRRFAAGKGQLDDLTAVVMKRTAESTAP